MEERGVWAGVEAADEAADEVAFLEDLKKGMTVIVGSVCEVLLVGFSWLVGGC